ncbi:MAG: hypothetical protein CMC35_03220 [Flavobacteriaceae bacterium]|nr:hypothetical protein [Flavobacteriaceae bacterium]|tara:strand:+ start:6805 stop:7164 length:360 start_codon:yes stop_codon:yes gene_type:complete
MYYFRALNIKTMKRLILILAVVFIGIQTSIAQNQLRPEDAAKNKLAQLDEQLDLSGDQERTIFRALVSHEVAYRKEIQGMDESTSAYQAAVKENDAKLQAIMKKTLSNAQYTSWMKSNN